MCVNKMNKEKSGRKGCEKTGGREGAKPDPQRLAADNDFWL